MKEKKLSVLFVLDHFWPHIGGAEVLFKELAEGLEGDVEKIYVVTMRDHGTKPYDKLGKIEIFRTGSNPVSFVFGATIKALKLSNKIDIIHTTTYFSAFPAWLVARLKKKKIIITIHEIFGRLWPKLAGRIMGTLYGSVERLLLMLPFDKYVTVSNYTLNSLRIFQGIPDSKLYSVYLGIDYKNWNPKRFTDQDISSLKKELNLNSNFIYLYYGRAGISKGIEYLINAVPEISKELSNSKLVLILSPHPKKRYEKMMETIKELRIEDKILILSPREYSELPKYLMISDCVVVPSLAEGFGFTAAESCALEKPIVVSQTASLTEVVSGNVIWSRPGDSKSIADGVVNACKKNFFIIPKKEFNWADTIKSYQNLYEGMK